MPRFNKITTRVFADVAETRPGNGGYDKFLSIDRELGITVSPELQATKDMYSKLVKKRVDDIKSLAALEEIIIEMRAKEMIDSKLRLSLNGNFIYTRSTFFRKGNKMNDIRVIVGTVENWGDKLKELINHPDFRNLCILELLHAMDLEISKNIKDLNYVYTNE